MPRPRRPRSKTRGPPRRWTCPACGLSVPFGDRWAHVPKCRGEPWRRSESTGDRLADLRRDTVASLARAEFYIRRHRGRDPEDRERRARWIQTRADLRLSLDRLDGAAPPATFAELRGRLDEMTRRMDRVIEEAWRELDRLPGRRRRPPPWRR